MAKADFQCNSGYALASIAATSTDGMHSVSTTGTDKADLNYLTGDRSIYREIVKALDKSIKNESKG